MRVFQFMIKLFGRLKSKDPQLIKWRVTRDGKLLLSGVDMTPFPEYGMTKDDLERRIRRMERQIAESGHPIVIEAIQVEEPIAACLFNEGVITSEHLKSAWAGYGQSLTFRIELAGKLRVLSIQTCCYYMRYQFAVSGHPKGDEIMRDVPDALDVAEHQLHRER